MKGKRSGNRFRRGWTKEQVIEKIREWDRLYNEPPRRSDWDPAEARSYMNEMQTRSILWADRIAIYQSGDWPSTRHVATMFGSWNAAIEAAALQPRAPGQRTARGTTPSPRLVELGHLIAAVYEADRSRDDARLKSALGALAAETRRLMRNLESGG